MTAISRHGLDPRHDQTAFDRYRPLIDDWEAFCCALERPLPPVVRANTLRLDAKTLLELLAREGIRARPLDWLPQALGFEGEFRPGRHWGQMAGLYQVQEEVSLLPVVLLDPRPGERVLDLCAAPGNKTAQLALALGNTGTVVANDLQPSRLAPLRLTIKRLGLVNVTVTQGPGQRFPLQAGPFDRVLVDGPCSCEGTYRKNPTAARMLTPRWREAMVQRQVQLLNRAVELTRPGGRIVYSTCTFAPEENEGVVDKVLRVWGSELQLLPARLGGFDGQPGITHWQGRDFDPQLVQTLRVWPHHRDTGGFFVAVLERRGGRQRPSSIAAMPAGEPGYLEVFYQRFALTPADLAGLKVIAWGRQYLQLVPADHLPPGGLPLEGCGLPAVRIRTRPPRVTTAAAQALGHHARRNMVEVSAGQLRAYLTRETFRADLRQLGNCTGPGPVLVRYQGFTVGLGQLGTLEEQGAPVASLFPKAWMRGPGPEG